MEGWISLYRKILDNPVVCKDSEYFSVWCYLLLSATHTKIPALFKNKKIILNPGQLITGRKSIAEKFDISESKVQRILKTLEIEQQIEQQTSTQNRLVTILRWNEYQQIEQQNKQQVNNERTTSEQQVNTNNNVINIDDDILINIYNGVGIFPGTLEVFKNDYKMQIRLALYKSVIKQLYINKNTQVLNNLTVEKLDLAYEKMLGQNVDDEVAYMRTILINKEFGGR